MNTTEKRCHHEPTPGMLITEIAKLFHDKMNHNSETLGFKNGYRQILRHLARKDGVTQIDLVRATHLKAPTISVTLKKMEEEELVRRVTDEKDQRQTHVYLTEKGREMERALFGKLLETDDILLRDVSEEEKEALCVTLKKIRANILEEMGLPEDWRSRP
jgi:DNA-binding MarR family transcriptional regulator